MTFFTVPEARATSETEIARILYLHTDIAPSSRSRVNSDNYSTLEPERECRRTVLNLDPARRVGVIVSV